MTSLQFHIDNLCANFTERAIYSLLEAMLAERPRPLSEITQRIADRDRTLDIKSAQTLAEAAVEALAQSGVIGVRGSHIYRAD